MQKNKPDKAFGDFGCQTSEIITADVYGDTQEIIEDCLYAIEPFIEEVMPDCNKEEYYDHTDVFEMENLTDEYWIAA